MFLISSVYLSWKEKQQADLNAGKNWWSVSFDNPKSSDLSFTIENHSNKTNFHYIVLSGTEKSREGDAMVAKSATWKPSFQVDNLPGKITVIVSSGPDKKEIYKNFN